MKSKRRTRRDPSVTQALILDATERVMVVEGYAAAKTRRVASEVGLTAALVHYYFPTTDDLLVAAYRRAVERFDETVRHAAASSRPLHALWNLLTDPVHMALGVEFMALANHRKAIRIEIANYGERFRRSQSKLLSRILAKAGIDRQVCPPLCAAMLVEGISRAFVMECVLGISCGHPETRVFVERLIDQIENENLGPQRRTVKKQTKISA